MNTSENSSEEEDDWREGGKRKASALEHQFQALSNAFKKHHDRSPTKKQVEGLWTAARLILEEGIPASAVRRAVNHGDWDPEEPIDELYNSRLHPTDSESLLSLRR